MGKVVKIVAVVAVAAAVAYFAPQISALILAGASATTTAAITAAVAATLSLGASLALQAFASKPHTSTAPGRQASRGQPMTQDGFARSYPPEPSGKTMPPVDEPWWRNGQFLPWQRFAVVPVRGTCMVPVMPRGTRWVVLDRCSPIKRGDMFLLKPDDLAEYMRASGGNPRVAGLVKRFVGFDPVARVAVYETTNPPNRIQTGADRIVHAYRVNSWHSGLLAALRARHRAARLTV